MAKIRGNEPCPCGSGRKYKHCCGRVGSPRQQDASGKSAERIPPDILRAFRDHQARENLRARQQGHGRPIISFDWHGYKFVAVGSRLHWSKAWRTFPDFLGDYIKSVIGSGWGNREIKKPYEQRHPILLWYDKLCHLQRATIETPGVVATANLTGSASAYLRLAYDLYLLAHNTKNDEFDTDVQSELIKRLKDREAFPGAFYEADVFGALIKAGFEVSFEDQSGRQGKRCEALIRWMATGEKFSMEAKSIRRQGVLGARRNTVRDGKPLAASIRDQLHHALSKAAPHPRIIFIDVNLPDDSSDGMPYWVDEAVGAVADAGTLTVKGQPTESAYVILTNRSDHHHQDSARFRFDIVAAGYKIADFGHGKPFDSFIAQYRAKERHIAVYRMLESLRDHAKIPSTFDGELPSVAFGESDPPVKVGERYIFEAQDGKGIETTVTMVTVDEKERRILVGTDTGYVFQHPISDGLLADYRDYGYLVFSDSENRTRHVRDPFEMFEFVLDGYRKTPKDRLLQLMKDRSDISDLELKDQDELALIFAEGTVYSMMRKSSRGRKAKD